jgi:hypothetical protein
VTVVPVALAFEIIEGLTRSRFDERRDRRHSFGTERRVSCVRHDIVAEGAAASTSVAATNVASMVTASRWPPPRD